MKYTLEKLQKEYSKGKRLKYIFFWGHTAAKNTVTKSCFSQWYKANFTENGQTFCCTEQYMMAHKALLFQDHNTFARILNTKDPQQIKELGRQVKNFQGDVWDKHKCTIVTKGNYLKFSQNKTLKAFMLQTKNKVLAEASPVDKIWGIGLAEDSEKVKNPLLWKGQNLLGFCLMEVRDLLLEQKNSQFI